MSPSADNTVDGRIVAFAQDMQKAEPEVPAILVTKDINLRVKADALGLQAEDYESDHVRIQDLYTGMFELSSAPGNDSPRSGPQRELELPNLQAALPRVLHARREGAPKRTALGRVDASGRSLVPILDAREGIWGIKPRNREQHFAFDALLDDRIKLVTLMGKAGTGKTLLAMAAGLKKDSLRPRIPPPGRRPPHHLHGQGTRLPAGLARGKTRSLDAADPRRARDVERPQHGP
jgi:PhoH-like ATPase